MLLKMKPSEYNLLKKRNISARSAERRSSQSNDRYYMFYLQRSSMIYDNLKNYIYKIKHCKYNVICFDNNHNYMYAFMEAAYKTKKEQRTLFCFDIPSMEIIKTYELDRIFFKKYECFSIQYIDQIDTNRFVISFYYPIEDGAKDEMIIYDTNINAIEPIVLPKKLKTDWHSFVSCKQYFVLEKTVYIVLKDENDIYYLYGYKDSKMNHITRLNYKNYRFMANDKNSVGYICYDENTSQFVIGYALLDSQGLSIHQEKRIEEMGDYRIEEALIYTSNENVHLHVVFAKEKLQELQIYDLKTMELKVRLVFSKNIWFEKITGYHEFAYCESDENEEIKDYSLNHYQIYQLEQI